MPFDTAEKVSLDLGVGAGLGHTSLFQEVAGTIPLRTTRARIMGHFTTYQRQKAKHTVTEGSVQFFSMLELFNRLLDDRSPLLDDTNIARLLMSGNAAQAITGCATHPLFMAQLDKSILVVAKSYRKTLEALQDSFKKTYRHKDISGLLGKTRVVTKPTLVKSRVFETAYILDKILDKKRFLAMSLLLGIMHDRRFCQAQSYQAADGRWLYNQGSVLFTLLTFSYTPVLAEESSIASAQENASVMRAAAIAGPDGFQAILARRFGAGWLDELVKGGILGLAKAAAKQDMNAASSRDALVYLQSNDVQIGWSLLGSCLGISSPLLPTTYRDAETTWGNFTHSSYARVDSELAVRNRADIRVFNTALEETSQFDQISFGASLKLSALSQTAFIGPVARVLGWYTSSNHAALTCIGCKTVHGSRVSLVRMWHRCTTCKEVYCWACAGRLQLAATVAVGIGVGVTAAWWGAVSSVYSVVGGVATSGATGRLGAAGMVPAKCKSRGCGGETEVIG
jgi:hypothetical protein